MSNQDAEQLVHKVQAAPQGTSHSSAGGCFTHKSSSRRLLLVLIAVGLSLLIACIHLTSGPYSSNPAVHNNWSIYIGHQRPQGNRSVQQPFCSFLVLQAAVDNKTGYLSANGTWERTANGGDVIKFKPTICKYKYGINWPASSLKLCLAARSVQRIVLMGDSNGARYQEAFIRFLNATDYRCKTVKVERTPRNKVDAEFYITDKVSLKDIRVHDRGCSGCRSSHVTCQSRDNHTTILSLELLHDTEVTSSRSLTSQEFLFKEYLRGAGNVPDMVIVFSNNHDREGQATLLDFRLSLRYFLDLIDYYLPASTSVIWLSKPSFYVPVQPMKYRKVVLEGRYSTNEWTNLSNRILYSEIKKRFEKKKRPAVFFDILGLVGPVQSILHVDGIHMKQTWYNHIISYVFQTFCAQQLQ